MRAGLGVISLSALLLPGCASTIAAYAERSTRKEPIVAYSKSRDPVSGVSLGASRREIVANKKGSGYFTCSEPAPDAASAYVLSSAFALGTKASANDAATTTALALAQPTEVAEFWRTTSYNYCLLLMNGDGTHADAYLNMAREFIATLTPKRDSGAGILLKPASKPGVAQTEVTKVTTKPASAATTAPTPGPTQTPTH